MLHGGGIELSNRNTTRPYRGLRGETPHVVVVSQWRQGYTRLPLTYVEAVRAAGGRPKVFSTFRLAPGEQVPEGLELETGLDPFDASPIEGACGLLIPGGGDIDPVWYGGARHPRTHNVSDRRDRFELTLLAEALERDVPVLAICHGMQLLNVHLGGTLDQHIADDPSKLDHDRDMPRAEAAHDVAVREGTLLARALGATRIGVNSHHHQGLDRVASELEQVAWAEDGVLEGVELRGHPWALGVQWHPEIMAPVDKVQRGLFSAFVDAAGAHRAIRGSMAERSA